MSVERSGESRIRHDLGVEFVFDLKASGVMVEWNLRPCTELSSDELGLYRRVHHRFLKCVSNKRGIPTVVIDP